MEPGADGLPRLRRGVSRDRRISLEDEQMRHGRKSRSVRVDGYKRHVLHDVASRLVCAVGVTAANAPEASVTGALDADLEANHLSLHDLSELHLDRGYLSSRWVRERPASLAIYCKACPVRNGTRFPKTAFTFDWLRQRIRCPAACWPLQGRRARYRGSRKNLFDLRRCAVVDNLHVLRRLAADTIQTA